jgi:hypothetical protein
MAVVVTAIRVMENGLGVGAEANSPTVSLHFRRRRSGKHRNLCSE